jgi:hypothetical protein
MLVASETVATGIAELAVTEDATLAHRRVILAGQAHLNGNDGCGELGISWMAPEVCPEYCAADALYTLLVQQGERGSAH